MVLPLLYDNEAGGDTYGIEWFCNYAVSDHWRLYCQYSVFEMHLFNDPSNNYVDEDPRIRFICDRRGTFVRTWIST